MPWYGSKRLKELDRTIPGRPGFDNFKRSYSSAVYWPASNLKMKICNFLHLNFCLLHLFPLLFGMHPGEGPASHPGGMNQGADPSGSLQPINSHPGGMYQGEGPRVMYQGEGSGTQQPVDEFTQLKGLIFPLLERVGNQEILQEIVPRPLRGPIRENIANVRDQYFNLVYAYIELFNTNAIIEQKNSLLEYLNQNMVKNIILFV
uniref:Uncharacterized protein n=1 Tax=Meloidogyne incognita TaxID=6306 RepID=A0A914M5T6_MELIC